METSAQDLVDRLARIELEQATLEAELSAFHADYMAQVGVLMARVHELEARYLRRHGDPEEARLAEEQARRTTAEARAVPRPAGPPPSEDLKVLFRDAAKRMHPDLARDEDERAHAEAFMKRLNDAYRAGDAQAIVDLLRQWEDSPYARGGDNSPARERVALRAAVAAAEGRLHDVQESDLAGLMEQVMAATARGEDLMAQMRANAEATLAAWQERLAADAALTVGLLASSAVAATAARDVLERHGIEGVDWVGGSGPVLVVVDGSASPVFWVAVGRALEASGGRAVVAAVGSPPAGIEAIALDDPALPARIRGV